MSFHVREQHLFEEVDFIGHSGDQLHWKIECDAITSPATGLLVFQTNETPGFYYFDGTIWVNMVATNTTTGGSGSGSSNNTLIYTVDGW